MVFLVKYAIFWLFFAFGAVNHKWVAWRRMGAYGCVTAAYECEYGCTRMPPAPSGGPGRGGGGGGGENSVFPSENNVF